MSSRVMDKGLVVIPKEIREEMGIKKGDRVQFIRWGRQVLLVPVSEDPAGALRGMLQRKGTMASFLQEKRRELTEEEKGLPAPLARR